MMSRHMYHVCGQPWIRTTAGPWPAVTWWIVTSPRLAKSCSKCEVIGGHLLGSWARQLCRASTGILVPSTLSSVQRPRFQARLSRPRAIVAPVHRRMTLELLSAAHRASSRWRAFEPVTLMTSAWEPRGLEGSSSLGGTSSRSAASGQERPGLRLDRPALLLPRHRYNFRN